MDGLEMIFTRRSVRSYSEKAIPDDILLEIAKAGSSAASALNRKPVNLIIVKNPELKKKLAQTTDFGKFIKQAAACLVLAAEDTKYYLEDGSACAENILLAARYYGIGSCWVAGDKKSYAKKIVELVEMPASAKLICLIALGYPKKEESFKQKKLKNNRVKIIE